MPARGSSGRGARGNPYLIAGGLPWGGGAAGSIFDSMSASDPTKALASHYQSAYNQALGMNQANYNNILRGYQQSLMGMGGAQGRIAKGYRDVMGLYRDAGKAESRDISDAYAKRQGSEMMNLIDSGLGNSTVTSSIMRGLTGDEVKEQSRLAQQVAQLLAGAKTNLLGYQERASNAMTGQRNQQLNWMNSIQSQYPDASMYAQLAQQAGAANQARDLLREMSASAAGAAGAYGAQFGGLTPAGLRGLGTTNAFNQQFGMLADMFGSGGGSPPQKQGGPTGGFRVPQAAPQNPMEAISGGLNRVMPGLGGLASSGYNIASQVGTGKVALNNIFPGLGGIFSGLFSPPQQASGGYLGLGGSYGAPPAINIDLSGLSGLGGLGGLWGAGGNDAMDFTYGR